MRPLLTASEMRAVDAHLIASGVPGIVLMENAGRGAAHLIGLRDRPRRPNEGHEPSAARARGMGGSCVRCADERALWGVSVAIVCGVGNNGGDGSVVAEGELPAGTAANADPSIDWNAPKIPTVCVMTFDVELPERPRYRLVIEGSVPTPFDRSLVREGETARLQLAG